MKEIEKLSNDELLKRMARYRPVIIILVAFMFVTFALLIIYRINHLFAIFTIIPIIPVYYRFNKYFRESQRRNLR